MAGLDPDDVQDVTDEPEQVFCRMVGDLQGWPVQLPAIRPPHRQLQHADDRIHRRADLVADGCQEGALGTIGVVGPLLGQAQFLDQLATVADVDPAADDPLDFPRESR